MVFREAVVDAVYYAAVSADIGYELLCPAYCAVVQDYLVFRGYLSLKIVLPGVVVLVTGVFRCGLHSA
jgi:hypothetical protein